MNTAKKREYSGVLCQRLVDHFANGGTVESFRKKEGIHRNTFRNWVKNYSEFADALELAEDAKRAYAQDKVEIDSNIKAENPIAYKYYVRHKLGLRDDDMPSVTIQTDKMDDNFREELDKFKKDWSEY